MGKFHDKLDSRKDAHIVAKVDVELWLSEFTLEYSKARTFSERERVVKDWFG